jgi:hypothetical protein
VLHQISVGPAPAYATGAHNQLKGRREPRRAGPRVVRAPAIGYAFHRLLVNRQASRV